MSLSFRELTAVRREDTDRFGLDVEQGSFIARGPNGGYIAAVLLRALQQRVGDLATDGVLRSPRSMTIHYPAAPAVGPASITTDIVRAGRSLVTASARMEQNGKPMAVTIAAFSPAWPGESWTDEPVPTTPAPDDIADRGRSRPPMPFIQYWEHRFTKGDTIEPRGPAEIEGWIRLVEREPIDAPVIAAMTDAFPPAIFSRSDTPNPVPTVDLTIHFRTAIPVDGFDDDPWVLGRFRTRTISEGFLEENGELWSEEGGLLAQSRQLAIRLPG